ASKVQVSARNCASLATQVTLVVPIGRDEPLGGVQATETGAAPPMTVGAVKVSVAVCPLACSVTGAGQDIFGPVLDGPVGLSPQLMDRHAVSKSAERLHV